MPEMSTEMDVSIERLAGQLRYLFEDDPGLRRSSPEALRERLTRDDRFARARQRYPLASDDEIRERVAEFDDRISVDDVRSALEQITSDPDDE